MGEEEMYVPSYAGWNHMGLRPVSKNIQVEVSIKEMHMIMSKPSNKYTVLVKYME